MRRGVRRGALTVVAAALATCGVGGCGAGSGAGRSGSAGGRRGAGAGTATISGLPQAHPQAVEPQAGVGAGTAGAGAGAAGAGPAATTPLGDPNAHAPSLAEVRRELNRLNLCGGTTDAAQAAPIAASSAPGFVADPGTQQTEGQLPLLTHQLDLLGKALGVTIYGISGYRSPAHSVAVGGYANDPHTVGEAEDIGVGSLLRSSAAAISERTLARFGLYRPFDPSDDPNNTEVNHVQLIPSSGALTLAQAQASYDPDPSCT